MTMKVITGVAFAFATLLASPAFAQSANQWDAYHAYAQSEFGPARGVTTGDRQSPHRSWDVYNTSGRYVGTDPDPNVRQMIQRDRAEQDFSGF